MLALVQKHFITLRINRTLESKSEGRNTRHAQLATKIHNVSEPARRPGAAAVCDACAATVRAARTCAVQPSAAAI
jgi:hypothetical protein